MLPEIGQFALALALCLALAQSVAPMVGAARGMPDLVALSGPTALGQFAFLLVAFVCLVSSFVSNDFTVEYVASNSNLSLPVGYRVSAVWGAHEGSLLLWSLMIAGWGAALALFSRGVPAALRARVVSVIGMVGVGFLLFMILTSNPFARSFPPPVDGQDLNPLLQDPGLAIHPPMLYMGYVGFSVAFAFGIAALIEGRLDSAWVRWARPWTLLAWSFLTVGITLGSWWAYNELGWGGWWFWDPVENASFMPWLAGTALVHSLAVSDKRGLFKAWSVFLSVLTFALCLLGTFLVRSGVLTSVHAFASDPARGVFILALLAAVVGGALALYAWRAPALASPGGFAPASREMCLLANNVFLVVATFTVLLGTLYPLALDVMGAGKVSIGPPYFNSVLFPLMAPAMLVVGMAMFARWRSDRVARVLGATWRQLAASVAVGVALPLALFDSPPWQSFVGAVIAAWVLLSAVSSLRGERPGQLSRGQAGMALAHGGIAVFIVGVTFTSNHGLERDVLLTPGGTHDLGGYSFRHEGIESVPGPNYMAQRARMTVTRGGDAVAVLLPEKRFYLSGSNPMTEAAIDVGPLRDLYVSLGDPVGDGSWSARLQVKPFVRWIWAGAMLMALGGVVAATDRRYRRDAPGRARPEEA